MSETIWQGFGVGTFAEHVHHMLCCPAEVRIAYILSKKPEDEHALRLRCFASVDLTEFPKLRESVATWNRAVAAWRKARAESEDTSALWRKTVTVFTPNATREKLYDTWKQANVKLSQTKTKLLEAEVALRKICAAIPHAKLCPLGADCPWDGYTILPEAK
jgi:hypothetical protein